jgi:hypothetical protein
MNSPDSDSPSTTDPTLADAAPESASPPSCLPLTTYADAVAQLAAALGCANEPKVVASALLARAAGQGGGNTIGGRLRRLAQQILAREGAEAEVIARSAAALVEDAAALA